MSDAADVVLARIETKLDTALRTVDDHEVRIRQIERIKPDDVEARLRRLERALWMSAGAAAAVGGGIGATLSAVFRFGH